MTRGSVQKERTTDLGTLRIHNEVLASVAAQAAIEIKGVHKLGGGPIRSICDFFTRKSLAKGIRINANENEINLSVSIVVDYGVNIPHVADEVQENIKRQVEKMAGLALHEVNVNVEGVHLPEPAKREEREVL